MIRRGFRLAANLSAVGFSRATIKKGFMSINSVKSFVPLALTHAQRATFAKKTVPVPKMGDSITDGVIFKLTKNVGDYVELDEIVAVIETDKVKVDIRSPEAGALSNFLAKEGDTIQVGKEFFEIDTAAPKPAGGAKPKAAAAPEKKPEAQAAAPQQQAAPAQAAAPAKAAEAPKQAAAPKSAAAPASTISTTGGVKSRNERKEPMSRLRQRVAQRLKDSQNTAAALTTFNEVDMSALIEMRNAYKDEFQKKHKVKLGFMSAFVRASVIALRDQPAVNASIQGNEIIYRDYVDISVAVATPTGLIVPVLRNCETLSFAEIEKYLEELGKKGKEGTITTEEMAGGSFTISNGGVFGSLMGTPILNPPQSAILGMHAVTNRAVVKGEQIVARPMMFLALTYDHRLIDGREAVTFLKKIKETIEDPRRIILDL